MSISVPGAVQISLQQQDAIGGHTISNHVGKSDLWLQQRLAGNPTIPAASTFTDLPTADNAVTRAIQAKMPAFSAWLNSSSQAQMVIDYDLGSQIGRILGRSSPQANQSSPATKVRVITRKPANAVGHLFYAHTAFPIL